MRRRRPRLHGTASLARWLALAFVPAGVGAPFAGPGWYNTLSRPSWAPPARVFGPVWTVLYATMGVSAWLVSRQRQAPAAALRMFRIQLFLNGLWTPLFFGLRRPFVALVEIAAMWVAILVTTVAFWRSHRVAGLMLLPYLGWVAFATALNAAIWRRNR